MQFINDMSNDKSHSTANCSCGFFGSHYLSLNSSIVVEDDKLPIFSNLVYGHIAMTFSAISILVTLKDDLSKLRKTEIINGKVNSILSC